MKGKFKSGLGLPKDDTAEGFYREPKTHLIRQGKVLRRCLLWKRYTFTCTHNFKMEF